VRAGLFRFAGNPGIRISLPRVIEPMVESAAGISSSKAGYVFPFGLSDTILTLVLRDRFTTLMRAATLDYKARY
jgi:hypothetical protein